MTRARVTAVCSPNLSDTLEEQVHFRVAAAPEDGTLAIGQTFTATGSTLVLGRSVSCDQRIPDATISRQHVRLECRGEGIEVECLTAAATFVNGERLQKGERARRSGVVTVQMGAVVLEVEVSAETMPYRDGPILAGNGPVPRSVERPTFLEALWESGDCEVRLDGRRMALPPLTARVLGGLCESPAVVVSTDELAEIGGAEVNVGQQVSYIRRAFLDLLEAGALSRGRLRALIAEVASDLDLHEIADRELVRRLIRVKRGAGYILCLPPAVVKHP